MLQTTSTERRAAGGDRPPPGVIKSGCGLSSWNWGQECPQNPQAGKPALRELVANCSAPAFVGNFVGNFVEEWAVPTKFNDKVCDKVTDIMTFATASRSADILVCGFGRLSSRSSLTHFQSHPARPGGWPALTRR